MTNDLTNRRFSRLIAIERVGTTRGSALWLCRCDCGGLKQVASKHLVSGSTRSCGCLRSEIIKALRASSAQSFEARLARVKSGCLEWQGCRDKDGYGTLRSGKKDHKAHRIAYEKAYGPIPEGRMVCHTCDNPRCCDPSHLFLGTPKDNKDDCVRKRRHAFGARQVASKVNDHLVRRIRSLSPTMGQQAIANLFGIDQTTVSKIVTRKAWQHVE